MTASVVHVTNLTPGSDNLAVGADQRHSDSLGVGDYGVGAEVGQVRSLAVGGRRYTRTYAPFE
jgi:hypothetical protein